MLPLEEVLAELPSLIAKREMTALDDLVKERRGRIVLFGAGSLGKRALAEFRNICVEPLCISDNNQERWDSSLDGCPILSPADAARKHGATALFFVTIWNANHWFVETKSQLRSLRCEFISSFSPIYWRFAKTFIPFLLNDLPHKVYEASEKVLAAQLLWADQASLGTYRSLIYWYATGDASYLPARPRENSYFPSELFSVSSGEVFVDCGAFDGDTVRQLIKHSNHGFREVHAIEADPISQRNLAVELSKMPSADRSRVQIHSCAIGANRSRVYFDATGTVDSKMRTGGGVEVDCIPLDELFRSRPVTMIKMDIEGAEFDALLGATNVIQRDRPILAICVYHAQNDIWRIPLLVKEMVPEYCFYLRSYEGDGFQTVMYAVPPERLARSG